MAASLTPAPTPTPTTRVPAFFRTFAASMAGSRASVVTRVKAAAQLVLPPKPRSKFAM
ncbi:Uncharacterised protein [Mycobacteroides abscessus subsp. abscessus]|nr:Uncharacterised protein [Mycobacteroides abscessus subsp. abscessus]